MTDILCACGCGQPVPKARYPSQQRRYINFHQHRGTHNGNYRGGKIPHACPVCGATFYSWPSKPGVTCGKDECYREWQRLTTAARGLNKVITHCANCGKELRLFPSQIQERNFCSRKCLADGIPQMAHMNGNWRGGKARYHSKQALIRDNYRCVICGFDLYVETHHITPRSKEGPDDASNLITLCPNHHKLADLGIINVEHLRR